MTSMSCFSTWLPTISRENGKILISGRYWCKWRPVVQDLSRGVKTAVPAEEVHQLDEEEENIAATENRIKKIRNISRLRPEHRNIVHRMVPSEEKKLPSHFTVLYKKRMFGRYGYASGVNPSLCWPSKKELADKKEFEKVAYPYSILEVAEREAAEQREEEEKIYERDATVAANVQKMLKMKEEFLKRLEKQKTEAEAAKAFKTRLIEEVRLHFNYTVNERDERFRLELKERAKQLREKEKLEKKTLKKEKQAIEKAAKFEKEKEKLKEEERISALKSGTSID